MIDGDLLQMALPSIRDAVISTLAPMAPDWLAKMRAGCFDGQPLMQAAIAGWQVGIERMQA